MSKKTLFIFLIGALFLSGCAAPVKIQKIINAVVNPEATNQSAVVSNATSTYTEATNVVNASAVQWQKPVLTASLGLLLPSEDYATKNHLTYPDYYEDAANYFLVGTIIYNGEPNKLVMVAAQSSGLEGSSRYFFADNEKSLTFLQKNSSPLDKDTTSTLGYDGLDRTKFTIDVTTDISDLHNFPDVISGTNPRQRVVFKGETEYWVVSTTFNNTPAFTGTQGRSLYGSIHNGFFLMGDGPLVAEYALQPDFFDKDNLVPQITWANGEVNKSEYSYVSMGGCGSSSYLKVVDPKDINVSTDLVVVGKNNQNDLIYELKDTNSQRLKDVFNNSAIYPTTESGKPKLAYEQFLATRPLLYWVDPFGRLVELQNSKFQPQAECGKPVIYLYPKKTMDVSVNVKPPGGLTYSEPELKDGWEVEATPYSNLTEIKTGRYYPYLFWEGRGDIYEQPKLGWVVKRSNVKQFLITKLAQLGLKRSETNDFLDFWWPKMQEKPYYFITFLGNATMDKLAPLTVTPKPDTIIRILMDFTPLDKPVAVKGFAIRTPKRKGFTVVEWGGVVR